MPKTANTKYQKITKVISQYPNEFMSTPSNELYCKYCDCIVRSEKHFFIESHRKSTKHSNKINLPVNSVQDFINVHNSSLVTDVTKAFLSADIPLNKLSHPAIQEFFKKIGKMCPSVSNCRNQVPGLANTERQKVKEYVRGKMVFIIADESNINDKKFIMILIGILEAPTKSYMINCKKINVNVTNETICHIIDDALRFLEIERANVLLLLTDAARYMVLAGNILKSMYPNMFHVTCIAHLLHNCAMLVRSYHKSVDNLIARVKAAIVKNADRRSLFTNIGFPSHPVITRWGTWLKTALWYAENLPKVKEIVETFTGNGLLTIRMKEAISDTNLSLELVSIMKYRSLLNLVSKCESSSFTIADAAKQLEGLDFMDDPCQIKLYINKRLQKNDIINILSLKRNEISPAMYSFLHQCQSTSTSVERGFSMLKHMLRDDRHFLPENVENYALVLINNVA